MAKPLDQSEIDALLGVNPEDADTATEIPLDSPAEPEKLVYTYNFKRPRLFSQDQMRVLNQVHDAFARDLGVYLSAQLRTIVDINLTALDQVLYSEYVISSAAPSALFVVDVIDNRHQIVFELDTRFVIFTIEKLFGGLGEFLKQPRETSQIEQRIMGKVMARAFDELSNAWRQVAELEFEESSFESNAEFVQIIPGSEPSIVVTFEVTVYEQRSFVNICYPYLLIEAALGRKGMRQWMSTATSEVSPQLRQEFESNVRSVEVEMRANLGTTKLLLSDLMNLEKGDVILLNQRKDEPIPVYTGDQLKFQAVPGKSGTRRALRIVDVLNKDTPEKEDESVNAK